MLLSAILKRPVVSTIIITALIAALATALSALSYQTLGVRDPGLLYEVLSALGISAFLAPVFLYPWILTAVKLRNASVEIRKLATTDALTGLPNVFLLRKRMSAAIRRRSRNQQLAVLFIDLDKFKIINDTLGHRRGDALLVAVAARLRTLVRDSDLVARFGADEFVVLQSTLTCADEASLLAGRIVDELSKPYEIDGHEVTISASIGIAVAPLDGSEPDQLLTNADMALHEAKKMGRHTWRFFEAGMAAAAQARRNIELDLRAAIANKDFEIHYQPIVELASGRITTCEALVRWRDKSGRLVPPAEFVPIAEEIGAIAELGSLVLHQACAACANWPGAVRVAVNFSSVQFSLCNVPELVAAALAKSRLPAERLEVEITESLLLKDFPATRAAIQKLRLMGARVALDDFGTGYSGLNYLHSFPLDKVKIDRSFLAGLPHDERSLTLIRGIARLSAALGLTVTMEGIENITQLQLIAAEKCVHEAQGHLLSPPLPEAHLREMLAAGTIPGVSATERLAAQGKPRLHIA